MKLPCWTPKTEIELSRVDIAADCPCGHSIKFGAIYHNWTGFAAFKEHKEAKYCAACGKRFAVHVTVGPVIEVNKS